VCATLAMALEPFRELGRAVRCAGRGGVAGAGRSECCRRSCALRFTAGELARGFNYYFGVLTLYVVSAVVYADVIG
jgi:hypothetical protein